MKQLVAYHGSTAEKDAILEQLREHAKADELVKGYYWEKGKGCAVGCTVHSSDHSLYESKFGVPQMLARLEDTIFEGLRNGEAKEWPIAFMSAIAPGADLSLVGWKFLHWLLTDEKVNPGINHPVVKDAVKQCADVLAPLTKGRKVDQGAAWRVAESAAASAAESAASAASAAARRAAWSAASAAARRAAWSAARSAASAASAAARRVAESAAASAAESAAESAAWSAASAAARRAAWSAAWSAAEAARSAAYVLMSEKLLELLREAPQVTAAG